MGHISHGISRAVIVVATFTAMYAVLASTAPVEQAVVGNVALVAVLLWFVRPSLSGLHFVRPISWSRTDDTGTEQGVASCSTGEGVGSSSGCVLLSGDDKYRYQEELLLELQQMNLKLAAALTEAGLDTD